MEKKNITYLKLYVALDDKHFRVYNFDKEDANELFTMLVRLERKNCAYRIKMCQAMMSVPEEGGSSCMK